MPYFWDRIATFRTTMSAKVERLQDAERSLIALAFQNYQKQQQQSGKGQVETTDQKSSSTTFIPPKIEILDTIIPMNSIYTSNHDTINNHCLANTHQRIRKDSSTDSTTTATSQNKSHTSSTNNNDESQSYMIHNVAVTSQYNNEKLLPHCDKPLVLLHGYMNGGAYFYRNFIGLSQYFTKIYAIDQLGWGLSSRPSFTKYFNTMLSSSLTSTNTKTESTATNDSYKNTYVRDSSPSSTINDGDDTTTSTMVRIAESFFVESLEAWRKVMKIDSMVLAGHSMGGLLAVAYTEKYPQHVHQLILISPVGVPEETTEMIQKRAARMTWRFRLFETLFSYISPGDILRTLPESIGKKWIEDYITRRLPAITDPNEQRALSEYLYSNNGLLPGSGEYCLPKLLKPSVFGRIPLQYRIPLLKVRSCTFLYGDSDWMDINGGLDVEDACKQRKRNNWPTPDIDVYQVSNAGHLLMLENSDEFNNGIIMASMVNEAKLNGTEFSYNSRRQLALITNTSLLPTTVSRSNEPDISNGTGTTDNVQPILNSSPSS